MRDMLDNARRAVELLRTKTLVEFEGDNVLQLAVTRLIEIVGEAATHVPPEVRAVYPEIPWREASSMRNWLIHAYHDVEVERLWDTVATDLPPLVAELERALAV